VGAVVQNAPSGDAVTVYTVMSAPPSELGVVHDTFTELSANTPTTRVATPGTVDGVAVFDASEETLVPRALIATTLNV
jgi:hypothetical protein